MAENEDQKDEPQHEADDDGPGHKFEMYTQCELVVERLKLLDYERQFVPLGDSFKPVSRHYFVQSTNVGEQFYLFTSLCAWLIRQSGIGSGMEMPHEFDDPNETIARILDALKAKDIEPPFAAGKLKSGSGPGCLFVLSHLTALALDHSGFRFGLMKPVEEEGQDEGQDDGQQADEAELTADQFEEEVELAEDVDDVGEPGGNENGIGADPSGEPNTQFGEPLKAVLHASATDARAMRDELKRVTPQLRVTLRAGAGGGARDWRTRAEQMARVAGALGEQYAEAKQYLARNGEQIERDMERIRTREHHLNEQFGGLLQVYRNRQNELAAISEQYRESSGTLNSRTETLNTLNEEIEQLKQHIEEQGMHNTSGAPILKVKQALAKIDRDMHVMRVQIACLEQQMWQAQLADRLNSTLDFGLIGDHQEDNNYF